MKPILTVARGRTCVLTLKNNTSWWHPMHLHGFSFRVLTRNGIPVRLTWHDTLLMEPNETADIAFVADNPGDWMLHCHLTDHQESGMMAAIRVS
jgi:FtsP/CotA-like multicopper oxidase with cupredoxin domain